MTGSIPQGFLRQTGVVLRRDVSAEGNVSLYLLLKGTGPVWASAPGAGKGRIRFGGGVEPLTWGIFNLYKGARKFYLKSVEVKEDFWALRSSAEACEPCWVGQASLPPLGAGLPAMTWPLILWCSVLVRDRADPGAAGWRMRRWRFWERLPRPMPLLRQSPGRLLERRGACRRAALRTDREALLTTPAGKFL